MYEQSGLPPHGPRQTSPGPRKLWYRRYPTAVIGVGVLAASIALGAPAHAATTVSTKAPSCRAQAKAWVNGGAKHQLGALQADLKALGSDTQKFAADVNKGSSTSKDVPAVRSAAAALRSAAKKVGTNPGPACIPGLRADLTAAAADYGRVGLDPQNAMTNYSKKAASAAASDFKAMSAEITKAAAKMKAASKAVSAYTGS